MNGNCHHRIWERCKCFYVYILYWYIGFLYYRNTHQINVPLAKLRDIQQAGDI